VRRKTACGAAASKAQAAVDFLRQQILAEPTANMREPFAA
jgi:hypothetical protein